MQSLIVLASLVFELIKRVKISGHPYSEVRASMEKHISGILAETAIN